MNTKGIKFLAVLAVMVMAFAAIAVIAPADNDATSIDVSKSTVTKDPSTITAKTKNTSFFISKDTSVKVTGLKTDITIYVQNGKELELNIKPVNSSGEPVEKLDYKITVLSVTSDKQRHTTSTVDGYATDPVVSEGKIVLEDTELAFVGVKGQTVVYKAMMPNTVDTYTTSDAGKKVVHTDVWTYDTFFGIQEYATISADKVLTKATIGSQVTIASGQFVEVDANATVETDAFGIYVEDIEDDAADSSYTYYATEVNAGSFEMNNDDDFVVVQNGTINVKNGTASIKAASAIGVYSDPVVITNGGNSVLGVAGGIFAGTITASGEVALGESNEPFTVDDMASVIINNNTTVTGEIYVDGKLFIKTNKDCLMTDDTWNVTFQGNGIIYAQNPKLWQYDYTGVPDERTDPLPYILPDDTEFVGLIDTTAINETALVTDRFASAIIERNQTFRVVGDVVVTTGLTVNGVLIIDEGASVTIHKTQQMGAIIQLLGQYGQIINNGTISIQVTSDANPPRNYGLHVSGGYFENNGVIDARSDANAIREGKNTFAVSFDDEARGIGFINNGAVKIGPNDTVSLDAYFENAGSISSSGRFSSGAFVNSGLFTLSSAKIIGNLNIELDGFGTVNINAAEVTDDCYISVFNESGEITVTPTVTTSGENNTLSVRGITVTNVLGMGLDLAGSAGVNRVADADGYATMAMEGVICVSSNALIGEKIALSNEEGAALFVSGDLTVSKAADILSTVQTTMHSTLMSVTGKVTDIQGRLGVGDYLGAMYTLPSDGTTIYTTIEDAISEANAAGIKNVDVGDIGGMDFPTVTEDLTIPAGMFVNGTGLIVGDDESAPVVTVESTASFNFNGIVVVEGMIYAENANDVNEAAIYADVKDIDRTTYVGKFMSLRVAIENAIPGQIIRLSQDFETVSKDLTIPAGITVVATDDDNEDNYFVVIDSNLNVEGTLIVKDFWFIATTDDNKKITVSGTIMDRHSDGDCFDGWWYMPTGVSYQLTLPDKYGNDETWFVITSLANLQPAIDVADESKVNIEGSPKLGDISIHGTEDQPAEVTFKGNVNAGTITMENVIIKALDGKKVTATFADAIGSITITGAYVDKELSIYSLGNKGVFMAGSLTDSSSGTYAIKFDGITGIDGTAKSTIGWGKYTEAGETVATPVIWFNGTTTAVGKKAVISNSSDEYDDVPEGMVTITGSLIADNNNKIVMYTDVQVLGGLFATERTSTATAGSIEIYGDLFVGTYMSDVYNAEDADLAYAEDGYIADETVGYGHYMNPVAPVAAAAAVSGKITVDDKHFITVMDGSEVASSVTDGLESMAIVIEGDAWITVYGTANYSMDGLKAPIYNAKVDTITDINGNPVALFSDKYKVIYGCPAIDLSDSVLINIGLKYDVFTVTIKTDGSVKAVYIDDILMYTGENRNTFTLDKVTAAETHYVKVEAATGYDADKCKLYTDEGTLLPGMAFIFSEFDCEYDADGFNTYNVIYNINGTEIQPEPVPPTPEEESQWTITTILLVILVVLIAIMAVIVALRLNRS